MAAVIDSHAHIGLESFLAEPIAPERLQRPAFRDRMANTIENLIARMDANGVDAAIAFGFPLKEIDRVQANHYVMTAHRTYPNRIIPFALVGDDVDFWLKQGAQGFKQQDILYAPERFNLIRAYQIMAEAGVPMLIHFRAGDGYSVAAQAKAILRQVPNLKLIVAHMGRNTPNTGDRVEDALLGLRDEPNVIFETSTVRDAATIMRAVEIVGPGRVVFGSDFPFNSYLDDDPLAEEIRTIEQADISPQAKEEIMGLNIRQYLSTEAQQ